MLDKRMTDETVTYHRGDKEIEVRKTVKIDMHDKVALVTGGASGLGLATAMRLLRNGAKVVIADYSSNVKEVAESIGAEWIQMDVTKEADVQAAVDKAVECYGKLTIAVASAGIGGTNCNIAEETLEDWNKVNAVDYTGVMLTDKCAINQFLKQKTGGVVINIASMFCLVAVPSNVAYSAAKGGVVNLTKAAGTAFADRGIRVNCICPGVINTPLVPQKEKDAYAALHPSGRIGEDWEVASIIAFLCSDDARFITGAAIPIDGGYTGV